MCEGDAFGGPDIRALPVLQKVVAAVPELSGLSTPESLSLRRHPGSPGKPFGRLRDEGFEGSPKSIMLWLNYSKAPFPKGHSLISFTSALTGGLRDQGMPYFFIYGGSIREK